MTSPAAIDRRVKLLQWMNSFLVKCVDVTCQGRDVHMKHHIPHTRIRTKSMPYIDLVLKWSCCYAREGESSSCPNKAWRRITTKPWRRSKASYKFSSSKSLSRGAFALCDLFSEIARASSPPGPSESIPSGISSIRSVCTREAFVRHLGRSAYTTTWARDQREICF